MHMQKSLRKAYSESLDQVQSIFKTKLQETRDALATALDTEKVETFDFKSFNKQMQEFENTMEHDIFKIISLQAPISKDLRLLLSDLKSSNDLRRIAKTISRISKVSKKYFIDPAEEIVVDPTVLESFNEMGKSLLNMFDQVLEIYSSDSEKLTHDRAIEFQKQFSQEDDNVDSLFKETLGQLVKNIRGEIDSKKQAKLTTETLLMIRHMERIGDHLCNIAERILYVETGNHFHIS